MIDPNQTEFDSFIAILLLLIALAFAAVPSVVQFFIQ